MFSGGIKMEHWLKMGQFSASEQVDFKALKKHFVQNLKFVGVKFI